MNTTRRVVTCLLALPASASPASCKRAGHADRHRQVAQPSRPQSQRDGQRDGSTRTLARADVVAGLRARGVSVEQARERVAALTDDEAAHVADDASTPRRPARPTCSA